jgi:hypothetical protein
MTPTAILRIHSTPMIHSPGMFRWIEAAMKTEAPKLVNELLEAFGIPDQYVEDVKQGNYTTTISGETLVLTIHS